MRTPPPSIWAFSLTSGEVRKSVLGQTAAGKILVVIAVALDEEATRIITAYPATPELVRMYRE